MAPPGAYPVERLALFNLTSQAIPPTWLQYIQTEADKDNDENTIIDPIPAGPTFTRLDMAHYSRQHFLSPDSPYASRCLLAADDKSIETGTVIIINLVRAFLVEEDSADQEAHEEKDVVEGYMRVHPNSCISFATIFDLDTQGIDKYDGIARNAPDGVLPRIDTPEFATTSDWAVRESLGHG